MRSLTGRVALALAIALALPLVAAGAAGATGGTTGATGTAAGGTTGATGATGSGASGTTGSGTTGTGTGAARHGKGGHGKGVAGPPPLPAAASPLLTQAVKLAGRMLEEQRAAVEASERYDEERIALATAERGAAGAAVALRVVQGELVVAEQRLQAAAIEAYVTDSGFDVAGLALTSAVSQAQTVTVYAQVDTKRLSADVAALAGLRDAAAADAARRASEVVAARAALVQIHDAKVTAVHGSATAEQLLAGVELQLIHLLGASRAADLLDLVPGQSSYKGPHLGGTRVGKVASAAEGRAAVKAAERFRGVPYVWGGASRAGVDCSGLVMLAWAAAGIDLEHGATAQWEESKPVPVTKLRPGDLLFYHFPDDGNDPITHVAMYVGSGPFGAETVIQAAAPGTVVAYAPIYFVGFVAAGQP